MKGHKGAFKSGGKVFYAGGGSNVADESDDKTDGFKKGGRAKKDVGKVAGGGSAKNAGRKPRKSGGKVFSSAAEGTKRPGFKG